MLLESLNIPLSKWGICLNVSKTIHPKYSRLFKTVEIQQLSLDSDSVA